jgi:DNA mismatch repair protein MutS2
MEKGPQTRITWKQLLFDDSNNKECNLRETMIIRHMSSLLAIILMAAADLVHSFSFLPRAPTYRKTLSSSTKFHSEEETARAGSGGYSILRQPLRLDPEEEPTFGAPASLREEDNVRRDVDWLNQRVQRSIKDVEKKKSTKVLEPSTPKTIENMVDLDLVQRTLDTLDYPIVLNALKQECTTHPARDLVDAASKTGKESKGKKKIPSDLKKAYQPLTSDSYEGLKERYAAVAEMQLLMDWRSDVLRDQFYRNRKGYKEDLGPPPMGGMSFNLKGILLMADEGNVLEGSEIQEVARMLDVLEDVTLWSQGMERVEVEGVQFVELPDLANCIKVNTTLQELLHNAFDNEGRLSGKTFPLIGQLRSRIRGLKSDILGTLDSILSSPSMNSKLALESGGSLYSEVNGRIVIPIDEKFGKSSLGIVHDASRSGKTLYVEPTEIVGPTNELRQAEAELRMEEARVWRSLTAQILENRAELEASVMAAGQLDLVMARVSLGNKLDGVIPEVGSEGVISLRDAKHPVLLLRQVENVVGSDIDLGADGIQGLVLTGPNSGGKTVILKLLGLVALMARNGIPVPAKHKTPNHIPRVDFFDPILADIGDLQSVGGDLSTFSGHMLVCREVLASSGENALLLLDELGSGTDPAQGVAIAQALLEALVDTGARCAITTHYMALKQLAASDDRFAVAGMQFVGGRPTYKLLPGTVGESFALSVAERFQLPQNVLDRASELMDKETRQMGDLIRELEDQKAIADQQLEELARKKREMEELQEQMEKERQVLEAKQLSARREEAKRFAKKLEEKEQVLEEILEKLKSDPSRRVVAKSWEDIKFTKRDALNEAENVPSVLQAKAIKKAELEEQYAELVPIAEMREKPDIQVGDTLQICQRGPLFAKEATVIKAGSKLEVKVGSMAMQVKLQDVALPNSNVKPRDLNSGRQGDRNAKAVERALQDEIKTGASPRSNVADAIQDKGSPSVSIRTESNTVDVRGCNMEEAKSRIKDKISMSIQANRMVIYVLHGYGERGILRTKVRDWLKSERRLVKRFSPADPADGGDAFTKVELGQL